jgi:hypothetical protein
MAAVSSYTHVKPYYFIFLFAVLPMTAQTRFHIRREGWSARGDTLRTN